MQKISLHQLRERRSARQERPRKVFVRRDQNHSVKIADRNFIDKWIFFCRPELRAQSFIHFEGVSYKVVNFLGSVRSGPQTLLACLHQRVFSLQKNLLPQVIRSRVGSLQQLIEELRGKHARQDRRDEQHQARHHQC